MGTDLTVVNAARVSMNKHKNVFDESDEKLINYLATHNHFTPFTHPIITLRETVPIFVARQRFKHMIGFCVAGDTQISFERVGKYKNGVYTKSIEELYTEWTKETKHSRTGDLYGHRKRIKRLKARILDTETDEFTTGHILDVMYSGIKECYKIILENGKTVTLTADHQVYTPNGWEQLKDAVGLSLTKNNIAAMSKEVSIACNGILIDNADNTYKDKNWLSKAKAHFGNLQGIAEAAGCSTHTIRKWLKRFKLQFNYLDNLTGTNGLPPWNKGKKGYKLPKREFTPEHKEAIRKARSGPRSNFWKGGISSDRVNIARWTKEQAPRVHEKFNYTCQHCLRKDALVVHHIVPVYADKSKAKDFDNLISLCKKCHSYIHANNLEQDFAEKKLQKPVLFPEKKKTRGNTLVARYSKIISIEYVGHQKVYDISIDHPSHNFVGNGVVLHNCYNEVSRRYVKDDVSFYMPESFREAPQGNIKQGSGKDLPNQENFKMAYLKATEDALNLYEDFLALGVAPEQARMVLPQSMMTSYYVTGSLAAFARAYKLRSDEHSQKEIQDLAKLWNEIISPLFPISWKALTK